MPPPIIAKYSGQCQCDARSRTNINMLVTDLTVIKKKSFPLPKAEHKDGSLLNIARCSTALAF